MAEYKYLDFLEAYHQWWGLKREHCTNEEVDQIEKEWGVKFPLCYRELYLVKGKYDAFTFHEANDYVFDEFHKMQAGAKKMATANGLDLLNDKNNFVFSCYGPLSTFWFFKLDEGEDPPVYECGESGICEKVAGHLSDFIKSQGWYQNYLRETGRQ